MKIKLKEAVKTNRTTIKYFVENDERKSGLDFVLSNYSDKDSVAFYEENEEFPEDLIEVGYGVGERPWYVYYQNRQWQFSTMTDMMKFLDKEGFTI